MNSPKWTYTSDSCGYTLFKDGVSQGGARTMGTATHTADGKRRSQQAIKADRKMFAESARRQCDVLNERDSK